MYIYGLREQGNDELHTAFLEKLKSNMNELDFSSLHNVIYYLMFKDVVDKDIWEGVIATTISQKPQVLPLPLLTPFKFSKHYLNHNLPELEKTEYTDMFWHAEGYYNAFDKEFGSYRHEELKDFKIYLAQ